MHHSDRRFLLHLAGWKTSPVVGVQQFAHCYALAMKCDAARFNARFEEKAFVFPFLKPSAGLPRLVCFRTAIGTASVDSDPREYHVAAPVETVPDPFK